MSSFDPTTVRRAVAEFTPRRPEKFQDLIPAKEVIAELRQKRASYRAIAELLTQHCLPTSKTAVAVFCHELLGEIIRPRRRSGRKRPVVPTASIAESTLHQPADVTSPAEPTTNGSGEESQQTRSRGPRIRLMVIAPRRWPATGDSCVWPPRCLMAGDGRRGFTICAIASPWQHCTGGINKELKSKPSFLIWPLTWAMYVPSPLTIIFT